MKNVRVSADFSKRVSMEIVTTEKETRVDPTLLHKWVYSTENSGNRYKRSRLDFDSHTVYSFYSVPDPDSHVLGLPDPDPLVRGMDADPDPDPAPDPSIIKQK
jgi:hypothetical protein